MKSGTKDSTTTSLHTTLYGSAAGCRLQQVIHLACNMPIMPLVLATPYDLSFTVKSIEVRFLLRGGGQLSL